MCLTGDFANLDDGCCYNVAVLGIPQCSSACGTGGNCCGLEQAAHSHDKARVRTQVERIDSVTKAATNFRSSPDAGQPPAGLPRLRRATSAFTRVFDAPPARLRASSTRYGGVVRNPGSMVPAGSVMGPGSAEQRRALHRVRDMSGICSCRRPLICPSGGLLTGLSSPICKNISLPWSVETSL